ncbi:MAG: phosphatase PAP2/dual specificity phosphatase family protein [Alphaproteobacteria bacterium]|nr:phosphatase PAP2/dual specificity phosphatase family protein [Alphaproteobacteria bacterium]MCW5743791.1 phosphatase PAP2/dual specificity phosphatase family protein [Alphaproteobacteria bacterium]
MMTTRPWRKALLWLAITAVFFYASYGGANWLASRRSDVGFVVLDWERHIPFLAWSILPYWSINAFYAASFFVCRDEEELAIQVRRLLTAQIVAVLCFVLFPLRMTFERPLVDGVPGFLFEVLGGFDKPFNQAPSLHVALSVVLADFYARHVGPRWRWLIHLWFAIVAASVLTTWQHHFIDLPTGALLGVLVLWLWPWHARSPLHRPVLTPIPRRRVLALRYSLAAIATAAAALALGGAGYWLLWPALSLALVGAAYALLGAAAFQKGGDGRQGVAAWLLFLPYRVGAWINARLWTRRDPPAVHVADGVWIGRMPLRHELAALPTRRVVDLCAELPAPRGLEIVHAHPTLDLVPLERAALERAAAAIEALRRDGPVLVVCALGYGRSAAAIAAWLLQSGRAADAAQAVAMVRAAKPRIMLDAGAFVPAVAAP